MTAAKRGRGRPPGSPNKIPAKGRLKGPRARVPEKDPAVNVQIRLPRWLLEALEIYGQRTKVIREILISYVDSD